MRFPKRHPNHILETTSWKILQSAIPDNWILREVTERDYGIDAYLELVLGDGSVTGDLVSLQLKGVRSIDWKDDTFTFSGIRIETINYWMKLQVPVFLCVADTESRQVWFTDVKDCVRRSYKEFQAQKSLMFKFKANSTFRMQEGLRHFIRSYIRERQHERFSLDVTALLANCSQYAEFVDERYYRDGHLPLEPHDLMIFVHMIRTSRSVASHLNVTWNLKSIGDLLKEDRLVWKDDSCDLHEDTVIQFLDEFAPILAELIEAARRHVGVEYCDYWRATDPLLYEVCLEDSEFNYTLKYSVDKLKKLK